MNEVPASHLLSARPEEPLPWRGSFLEAGPRILQLPGEIRITWELSIQVPELCNDADAARLRDVVPSDEQDGEKVEDRQQEHETDFSLLVQSKVHPPYLAGGKVQRHHGFALVVRAGESYLVVPGLHFERIHEAPAGFSIRPLAARALVDDRAAGIRLESERNGRRPLARHQHHTLHSCELRVRGRDVGVPETGGGGGMRAPFLDLYMTMREKWHTRAPLPEDAPPPIPGLNSLQLSLEGWQRSVKDFDTETS